MKLIFYLFSESIRFFFISFYLSLENILFVEGPPNVSYFVFSFCVMYALSVFAQYMTAC